jgi:predicted permease
MSDFLTLIDKIYPLYLIVIAGYVAGRFLKADKHTISGLLIYIIAPIVVFSGVAFAPKNNAYFLLPVVFFAIACTLSLLFLAIGGRFWKTSERNLLSFIAGTGNTGYFGIPLSLALFGQEGLSIAVFSTLGLILYESTWGYYIIAKSHASPKEAVLKVIKLPVLYAFIAGAVANYLSLSFSESINATFVYFNGAYTVLGMMILGIGLSAVTKATFDKTFTALSFVAKFIFYPAIMASLIYIDNSVFHLFSQQVHTVMMLLSITPMATNTVTYASYLKAHPEKAAFTVMLSTLFALIYIPAFIALFLS